MIRLYSCALFFVLLSASTQAQTISFINNSAFVTYSSNSDNIQLDFPDGVTVSSDRSVQLRGEIYSDEFVLIKPYLNYTIVMKPTMPCSYCYPNADPPGTVIKPKPGGPGKIDKTTVVLYPVPAYTDLTFNISYYMVQHYAIFDATGVLKQQQNLMPTHNHTIDLSGLGAGNYILKLHMGNNLFFTKNFIKN